MCALGRLLVLMSTWWMVNSRGPAAPVEPAHTTPGFHSHHSKTHRTTHTTPGFQSSCQNTPHHASPVITPKHTAPGFHSHHSKTHRASPGFYSHHSKTHHTRLPQSSLQNTPHQASTVITPKHNVPTFH